MKACLFLVAVGLTMCGVTAGLQAQIPPDHAVSRLYNRSLGVDCGHCHIGNEFTDASNNGGYTGDALSYLFPGVNCWPSRCR